MIKGLLGINAATKYDKLITTGFKIGRFTADCVTEVSLKQTGRRGFFKSYILTISGSDNQSQLPDNSPREFRMEFAFRSIYKKTRIQNTLTGATCVEFIKTLIDDVPLMSFGKRNAVTKDEDNYVMNYTYPVSLDKNYTVCEFMDLRGSVFLKDASSVTFPDGLRFTA